MSATIDTFTAAVLRGGQVRLETHPLPPRLPGEVDVEVTLAAVCGSDLHTVSGRRHAPDGTGLGHEAVGRVRDLDAGTTDARGHPVAVGDRVVFGMIAACGRCDRCRVGLTMKCRALLKYGHATLDQPPYAVAMLADRVRLRAEVTLLAAPPGMRDEALVSVPCALATASAGIRALGTPLPDAATVLGGGAVGLYLVAMLADAGVTVEVIEPRADRRAVAVELGGRPADVVAEGTPAVLDASGQGPAISAAIAAAGLGARIVLLGSVSPGRDRVALDPASVVLRRQMLVGVHNYTAEDLVAGVDWLASRPGPPPLLVGETVALGEVGRAFELAAAGRAPRVGVVP